MARRGFPPFRSPTPGDPIRWELRLPTGAPGIRHYGLRVEVDLHPDATVVVKTLAAGSLRVIADGALNMGFVMWDQQTASAPRGDAHCGGCGAYWDARAVAGATYHEEADHDVDGRQVRVLRCGPVGPVAIDRERELSLQGVEMIEASVEEVRRLFRAGWLVAQGWADPRRIYEFTER